MNDIEKFVTTKNAISEHQNQADAEIKILSKKIAEEIKNVLRNYGATLMEWNRNLYVVPKGFKVYSEWDHIMGSIVTLDDFPETGLTYEPYNNTRRVVKPYPKDLVDLISNME